MHHLRKLGFGPGPDQAESDPETWLDSQLTDDFPELGYSDPDTMSRSIGPWPDDLNPDLTERVRRALGYSDDRRSIRRSKNSSSEKQRLMDEARDRYQTIHPDQIKFCQAPTVGDNQFKLRLAHFWANHFTVGFSTTASNYLIGHFLDEAIYRNLDGSFSDMLYDVETHPAMLTYLDNVFNIGENSRYNRNCRCAGLNDNLARETMELHSVSPARGYTEDDIRDAAKIFAGWGAEFDQKFPGKVDNYWRAYLASRAEPGKKTVLGKTFDAGPEALRQLTDHLAQDPMTAQFLSRKLAHHFLGDDARDDEIAQIREAWLNSDGHLPTVHRTVATVAMRTESKKFLWPMTWLFQLIRISDARLFSGYTTPRNAFFANATREPRKVLDELGMNFWSIRQPNGYSDRKVDWISSEHFERRIRFAYMLSRTGEPRRSVDDMADIIQPGQATKAALKSASSEGDRFVLLACSKEFFEV